MSIWGNPVLPGGNGITSADNGKVVVNGELTAQAARAAEITENGTYDTTLNNSVTVNVSRSGAAALLYILDESQGGVWIDTNITAADYEYLMFKRKSGDTVTAKYAISVSNIIVKVSSDVFTTIFSASPTFNIRIYNGTFWVSYNGRGASTNTVEMYGGTI